MPNLITRWLQGPEQPTEPETRSISGLFNPAGQMLPVPTAPNWGWLNNLIGINATDAAAIPAVAAAIRLVTETMASLPLLVYKGHKAEKQLANDTWQHILLSQNPAAETTPYDFIIDIAASMEVAGNAFIFKNKVGDQIFELHVLDPDTVFMKRDPDTGRKVFELYRDGKVTRYGTETILHIRGAVVLKGAQLAGLPPLALHRSALGVAAAMEQFVGRFFQNDARPGIVLTFPGTVNRQQAGEWVDTWNANHGGVHNSHRTAVLGGGGDIKTVPINLNDAQFIQSQDFSVAQIARMFRVPMGLLDGTFEKGRQNSEQEALNFLTFSMLHRLRRVESALAADTDLFPGTDLYPQFDVTELLRADSATRAGVQHQQIQDGLRLVDELRAEDGFAPLPPVPADWTQAPGKVPQITPVGGAPNPTVSTAGTAATPDLTDDNPTP